MRAIHRSALLASMITLAACSSGPKAESPVEAKGEAAAATTAKSSAAPASDAGGLREAAKALEACEPDPAAATDAAVGAFDACDAWFAWTSKVDATKDAGVFFELLASSSEKQRYAAAYGLVAKDPKDKASVEKLVAAAEREKSPIVGGMLGTAIDSEKAMEHGLGERVLEMARGHENKAVRIALAGRLFQIEGAGPVLLDFMSDSDPAVRKAGVEGLWMIGNDVSCPAWQKALDDADLGVAFAAANKLVFGDCAELAGDALAWAEKAAAKHPDHAGDAADAAANACRSTKPKPIVAKATALAKKLTAASFPSEARVKAVSALHDCAPDDKLFAKLAKDRDEAVQREAARYASK